MLQEIDRICPMIRTASRLHTVKFSYSMLVVLRLRKFLTQQRRHANLCTLREMGSGGGGGGGGRMGRGGFAGGRGRDGFRGRGGRGMGRDFRGEMSACTMYTQRKASMRPIVAGLSRPFSELLQVIPDHHNSPTNVVGAAIDTRVTAEQCTLSSMKLPVCNGRAGARRLRSSRLGPRRRPRQGLRAPACSLPAAAAR